MARQQLRNYVFTPAGAGVGTVKVPGNFAGAQILTILNTTSQTFIYNFADPTLGAVITWQSTPDVNFPTSIDGVTTITLTTGTASMNASDKLAIYAEVPYVAQRPFATDAVERLRIANPQSLIDADFEYGLQNTKWQSLFTNNDNPSIYEVPGSDVYANIISYVGFTGAAVTSNSQTSVVISNNGVAGNNAPNWTPGDFAVTWNPYVANPPATTYLTANVASENQRGLTVQSSSGFSVGQNIIISYAPTAVSGPTTTVSTSNLSPGTTSLSVTSGTNIATGSMIMVFTANTTSALGFQTELMTVTAGGGSTSLTVARNRLGSNAGNAYITSGAAVYVVAQAEVANIVSIPNSTTINVNRAYMNTISQDLLAQGSVIQAINWDASTGSGTNVEIIQTTIIGNAAGNTATIARGAMGTTAVSALGSGSPVLRLSGIFVAGSANLPLIGVNLPGHHFVSNGAVSTTNHVDTNSEGQYQVVNTYPNYFTYYPRRGSAATVGYQLNRWDTQIRYAGFYGTASLPQVSFTSDGATPSTITGTTAYAHGLAPATPILANLIAATNSVYCNGSFTILSIPTPTTFTFQAKAGASVTGPITGAIYARPSAFFTHRAADGGVLLGTGTPHHGASAARQTKKYFRYQSGKGLMWTSGTLLGSNFDLTAVSSTGTGAGSTITVTTDQEHQLQIGANIQISGIITTGYNGYYLVQAITGDHTFQVNAASSLGDTGANVIYQNQPKATTVSWIGASVRAGIFDAQNGVFFENTGTQINVVQRSATYYMTGTVSVEVATNLCTGDGTCHFTQQYVAGDKIVLRGMTHTVTSIIDDNQLTISPVWRGLTNQTRIKPSKVVERRVQQAQWNLDRLDGTGPSGYLMDPTKMQMLMIQYTWYGAGFVDYGVRGQNGNYVFCHRFMNNNLNYQAYMRTGNLPARYEAINDTPYQILSAAMGSGDTTFTIYDSTQFPTPTPTSPVYALIDNEIVKCTGITPGSTVAGVTPATVTGVTRSATFNLWQDGANKSFSAGSAAAHNANVSVRVISATSAPSLNHWGSAIILDGGFDVDRGYAYTYSTANVAFPSGLAAGNTTVTSFAMRLSPAVSNQIPGDLGQRDLVNRAQLLLQNMIINFSGNNVSTTTGARYLIEGILNPNNISTTSTTWGFMYNSPYNATTNPSGAIQPSYTQIAYGNVTGAGGQTGQISFTTSGSGVTWATGGERLFAIPVNYTNSGQLDLSMVKQLGNSGIPGYNIYPDGPELLAINITALVPTPNVAVTGEIQIQWNESQA